MCKGRPRMHKLERDTVRAGVGGRGVPAKGVDVVQVLVHGDLLLGYDVLVPFDVLLGAVSRQAVDD